MVDGDGRSVSPPPASPARAALADSWGAAHAFARFVARPADRRCRRAKARPQSSICRSRRCACHCDMVASLRVLGFERIGELAAQPRAPLALRFGPRARPPARSGHGASRRADRSDPPAGPDRGAPRLRRADRRARNHRPLHRQARRRSSARRSRRKASARGASICCFIASTTGSKRSASARRCRCAT